MFLRLKRRSQALEEPSAGLGKRSFRERTSQLVVPISSLDRGVQDYLPQLPLSMQIAPMTSPQLLLQSCKPSRGQTHAFASATGLALQ